MKLYSSAVPLLLLSVYAFSYYIFSLSLTAALSIGLYLLLEWYWFRQYKTFFVTDAVRSLR